MYKSQDLAEPAISALIRDEFLRGDWADEMGVAIILLGEERNMKGLSTAVPAPVMIRSHSVITEGTSDFYFLIFLSSAAVSTHDRSGLGDAYPAQHPAQHPAQDLEWMCF